MAEAARSTRRSDEIRRRRQVRQANPKPSRRKRKAISMPPPPPVLTRDAALGEVWKNDRRRKAKPGKVARRRYDVALNTLGAEIRLPSLPRLRMSWRAISFPLAGFLIFVLYQFWNSQTYRVDAAQVNGSHFLTSSQINEALGVTGKHIFALDASKMAQGLVDSFPEISAVSVHLEFPQTVLVTVTERTPVLIWLQDGDLKLVDEEGKTFPPRDETTLGGFPVVEASGDPPQLASEEKVDAGPLLPDFEKLAGELSLGLPASGKAEQLLSKEMVEAILFMAENAPAKSQLIYDPEHGLGWRDQGDWLVYLGDTQDFEMKLHVYEAILQHLKEANTRPTLISVEFVHAPYYELEQ
jgi:cell division septal protein FtsQ